MPETKLQREVQRLFSLSEKIDDQSYSANQMEALPEPVKRYFKYSLPEGQACLSYVRLKHGGEFRPHPRLPWLKIRGEEYFTLQKPGFYWLGKVPLISAVDQYIDGKGSLQVRLFSRFRFIHARGRETNQGEFLRWLAEAVWYPTALLPSRQLRWEPINDHSAKVIYSDEHLTGDGVFYFNDCGQIIQFNARRYYDARHLESWTVHCGDYREAHRLKVPFYAEVTWNLKSGDFTYAKFKLNRIEYDIPEVFPSLSPEPAITYRIG